MAATTRPATATERPDADATLRETAIGVLGDTVASARATASEAAARLPDASERTLAAFDEANRRIQSGTNEMLAIGTALSFGFALGLLIGGANRLLVGIAMVPVAMLGFTLLDRKSSPSQPRPSIQDG
jgi:hypothetical protein